MIKRLFLIRHGQSEGNVDNRLYSSIPDHKISITTKGINDAKQAAKVIQDLTKFEYIPRYTMVYSPYLRAIQTKDIIVDELKQHNIIPEKQIEDPRIREREWGSLRDICLRGENTEEHFNYFYKPQGGESFANLYDRVSCVVRWIEDKIFSSDKNYDNNIILISHGEFIHIMLQHLLQLSITENEKYSHPRNGEVYYLTQDSEEGDQWCLHHKTKRTLK